MKKLGIIAALLLTAQFTFAQSTMDLVKEQQCKTQEQLLKPLIKSSIHPKRSLKPQTWIRLANGYANYTTSCGQDSTSAKKAWDAAAKAKEVDTEGGNTADIDSLIHGALMYSAVMNQGVEHYNSGNLNEAVDLFKIATVIDESDTLATFYAGLLSNQLGNEEDAVKAFTQYIDIAKGRDASAYYTLSNIAKANDDIQGSIKWLKRGVEDTQNKDLQGELINTYINNDMLSDAVLDLETLVAKDPTHVGNTLNLGILYDNQGESQKALDIYSKVLKMDPDNYDCNFNLAVFHFNNAVKIKGEVDAMDIKTYQAKGKEIETLACTKFNEAKPYFEECERIKPGQPDVIENLKNLNRVLGQCK